MHPIESMSEPRESGRGSVPRFDGLGTGAPSLIGLDHGGFAPGGSLGGPEVGSPARFSGSRERRPERPDPDASQPADSGRLAGVAGLIAPPRGRRGRGRESRARRSTGLAAARAGRDRRLASSSDVCRGASSRMRPSVNLGCPRIAIEHRALARRAPGRCRRRHRLPALPRAVPPLLLQSQPAHHARLSAGRARRRRSRDAGGRRDLRPWPTKC